MKKYYKILGVKKDSTQPELKAAYYAIAKINHPDVNPGKEAEDKFKEASVAYDCLSDPLKRKRYDETGDTSDPEQQDRKEAIEMIGYIFATVIQKTDIIDLKHLDAIGKIRTKLKTIVSDAERKIRPLKQKISALKAAVDRVSVKPNMKGLPDVLTGVILQRVEEETNNLMESERQERVCSMALVFLKYYEYRNELKERGENFDPLHTLPRGKGLLGRFDTMDLYYKFGA